MSNCNCRMVLCELHAAMEEAAKIADKYAGKTWIGVTESIAAEIRQLIPNMPITDVPIKAAVIRAQQASLIGCTSSCNSSQPCEGCQLRDLVYHK